MARGAEGWNGNDGPSPLSAWCRVKLGWLEPEVVASSRSNVVIEDVEASGQVYKLPISDKEYFLVVHRQRSGYKEHIPAARLLI